MKRVLEFTLFLGAVLMLLTRAQSVFAASIVVDTTAQEVPFVTNGNCTLGEAIIAAEYDTAVDGCAAGSGADVIIVPAGLYQVGNWTYPSPDTDYAFPSVGHTLTIVGAGADQTILQALPQQNEALALFGISSGGNLTLDGVTLQDATGGYGGAINNTGTLTLQNIIAAHNSANSGGVVWNSGILTITNSILYDNQSQANGGGAITSFGGSLAISNSSIHDDKTSGYGGGIYLWYGGMATLDNVSIYDNTGGLGGGIGLYGGGVTMHNTALYHNTAWYGAGIGNNAGIVTIDTSQIHDNNAANPQSQSLGGGIFNGGTLTITLSTIANNSADLNAGIYNLQYNSHLYVGKSAILNNSAGEGAGVVNGGGIYLLGGTLLLNRSLVSDNTILGAFQGSGVFALGTLTVTNSTITNNHGTQTDAALSEFLGTVTLENATISENEKYGIQFRGGTLTLANTLIANNASGDCQYVTAYGGTFTSLGYNLVENKGTCAFGVHDVLNTDPQLGPLQDNGGPTYTQALSPNSPAIDAGDNTNCPTTDQRGITRPLDGNGDGSAVCDIGAYEADAVAAPTPTATATACAAPTQAPLLLKPLLNAALNKTRVALQWSADACAARYQVVLRQDGKKGKTILNQSVTALTLQAKNLLRNHRYYWRVRACNGSVCGPWSKWSNFKINP